MFIYKRNIKIKIQNLINMLNYNIDLFIGFLLSLVLGGFLSIFIGNLKRIINIK